MSPKHNKEDMMKAVRNTNRENSFNFLSSEEDDEKLSKSKNKSEQKVGGSNTQIDWSNLFASARDQ